MLMKLLVKWCKDTHTHTHTHQSTAGIPEDHEAEASRSTAEYLQVIPVVNIVMNS